jgi:glyoxylase-like metal-dependent hydrolase (beta-lactamase superfamily II)
MRIHRHTASPDSVPVNAYLAETDTAVVAVDATLTVSGGRGLRELAQGIGKPLAGVLVTHAHPDHYGGLVELLAGEDLPVYATAGVAEVIRRDDPVKEQILRPMFGDEWPRERRFPDRSVGHGESVELGGASFTVIDLGPGESPHDSVWLVGGEPGLVFSGDQAYHGMHAYLADGFHGEWLAHIARLRAELPPDATLYLGHGEPGGLELLDEQARYIETFVAAVREVDWSEPERARAAVVDTMTRFLPSEELRFLMELSVDPLAEQLGVKEAARSGP